MKLYHCVGTQPESLVSATSILTPLGNVRFEATIDQTVVSTESPSTIQRLSDGGWMAGWYSEAFMLEGLMCRPHLPDREPRSTDCWACLWRLEARAALGPSLFVAVWEPGYTWDDGGPDSGQHLYAWTWKDGQVHVTIGTEDEERLAYRVDRGDYLPADWGAYFRSGPYVPDSPAPSYGWHEAHVNLYRTGMSLPLPPLKQGQRCQIHFVVAWADHADDGEENMATWLAVDRCASDILQGAGCS